MKKVALYFLFALIIAMLGFNVTFEFGIFSNIDRLVGIPALFFWAIYRASTNRIRKPATPLLWLTMFFAWTVFAILWSPDSDQGLPVVMGPIAAVVFMWVAWDLCQTDGEVDGCMQALIYGEMLGIAVSLIQFARNNQFYTDRFSNGSMDPNELGLYIVVAMPIAWAIALHPRTHKRGVVLANLLFPVIGIIGLMVTNSRGSLLAFVPVLIFLLATMGRAFTSKATRVPILTTMAIGVIAISIFVAKVGIQKQLDRFLTTRTSVSTDSLGGRTALWKAAPDLIKQSPFIGNGAAGFRIYSSNLAVERASGKTGIPIHNTPLGVLVDFGIIGLTMLTVSVVLITIQIFKIRDRMIKFGFLAGWVALGIGVEGISQDFRQMFWLVLGLFYLGAHSYSQPVPSAENAAEEVSPRKTMARIVSEPV